MMSGVAGKVNLRNALSYSGSQRAAFAGILLGFILCCVGCFVPYWKICSVSLETPVIGVEVDVLEIREGLWQFCVKLPVMDEKCTYPSNVADVMTEISSFMNVEYKGGMWITITQIGSIVCLGLSLLTAGAACCRFCCCSGGRTMCHGFMTFLAGGCAIGVVAIFETKVSDIGGLSILDSSYGWAFFVFCAGAGITTISSFILCFATPRPNQYQWMAEPNPMPSVTVVSTNQQQELDYMPPN